MTTSHQLFLKEKKVDVVILAYLLLFVLLFTSWGQARNHHIAVRCPAKFLIFSPNLFLSFFAPRAVKGSCTVHFFLHYGDSKKTCNSSLLRKTQYNLGNSAQSTDNIEENSGTQKKSSVSRLFSFYFYLYSNATEKTETNEEEFQFAHCFEDLGSATCLDSIR